MVWDGKRAVGVEFVQWDNARLNGTVYARGEVVLSGGAINTPLLLTHSGVGPKQVLKKLKVNALGVAGEGDGVLRFFMEKTV